MILWELFITFFKIGAFTFGGGYAMIPLIQAEVLGKGWVEPEMLVNFIAVSESTPGPFALNTATFIGTKLAGITGGVFATLGVVLPSFIIILIVAHFYDKFRKSRIVEGCMSGLRPAVVGLISAAILSVAETAFIPDGFKITDVFGFNFICSIIIFGICAYLTFKKKTHPILIIVLSAVLGIAMGYGQILF